MNYELLWTEPALCDLEKIDRYLRRRNPAAARRLGEDILARIQMLASQPELGRIYDPEWPYRVWPHKSYRIFYRVKPHERIVEIAHIRHAARDNPTLDDLLTD